jgi:hypothetical protein
MLIRNYGLFWRRNDVFWGRQRVSGHLLGFPATNVTAKPVDFRKQRGVYVLYDDTFHMVYVGQAGGGINQRLFDRLKQHVTDPLADRWTRFSWFGIRWVKANNELAAEADGAHTTSSAVLDHIEAILISAAEPPHNRQGGRFGPDTVQYLQFRDDEALGPSQENMTRQLWKKHVRDIAS